MQKIYGKFKKVLFSIVALIILFIACYSIFVPMWSDNSIMVVYEHSTKDGEYGWFVDGGGSLYTYDFRRATSGKIPLEVIMDSSNPNMYVGPLMVYEFRKNGDNLLANEDSISIEPDENGEVKTLTYYNNADAIVVFSNDAQIKAKEADKFVKNFTSLSLLVGQ